jgi:hypothetical protein
MCGPGENKSFGTEHHLHSSSDVRELVSSTSTINLSGLRWALGVNRGLMTFILVAHSIRHK